MAVLQYYSIISDNHAYAREYERTNDYIFTIYAWCMTIHAWCMTVHAWCMTIHAWCMTVHAWCMTIHAWCMTVHAWWNNALQNGIMHYRILLNALCRLVLYMHTFINSRAKICRIILRFTQALYIDNSTSNISLYIFLIAPSVPLRRNTD